MRKLLMIVLCIFLLASPAFSIGMLTHDGVNIFGAIGSRVALAMTLDDVTTLSSGYSFLMTDDEVTYLETLSNYTGKRFGSWCLVANTNELTLTVEHTPLICEQDSTIQVDYWLSVQYCHVAPFNLNLRSNIPTELNFQTDAVYQNKEALDISYAGLFLRLAEPFDTDYPGGLYTSTITMTVRANS
jgi:hypothetical protein